MYYQSSKTSILRKIQKLNPQQMINKFQNDNNKIKQLINSCRRKFNRFQFSSFISSGDESRITQNSDKATNNYVSYLKNSRQGFHLRRGSNIQLPVRDQDQKLQKKYSHNKFNSVLSKLQQKQLVKQNYNNNQQIQNNQQNNQLTNQIDSSISKKQINFRIKNKEVKKQKYNFTQNLIKKPSITDKFMKKQQLTDINNQNIPLIIQYLKNNKKLTFQSSHQDIFNFFQKIHKIAALNNQNDSLIKRYKNCIFYGPKYQSKQQKYFGVVWYFKGILFIGSFLKGKKHGYGVQIDKIKQQVWSGNFQNGIKNGYFSIKTNSFKYDGIVQNGIFHGQGNLQKKQSTYKGSFSKGKKQGIGIQIFKNKKQYKGQYFQDKFDGQGQLSSFNYYYKGLFKEGLPDGHGFQRTNQYQYLGQFVRGKKQGKGSIKFNNGQIKKGEFKNNNFVEKDSIFLEKHLSKDLKLLNEEDSEDSLQSMLNQL